MAEKLTERAELTSLFWNPKPGRVIGIPELHLDEAQITDPFTLSSSGETNSRKSQSENFQFSLPIPPHALCRNRGGGLLGHEGTAG